MAKFLDSQGLAYLWQKIKAQLATKANSTHDHANASASRDGFMSRTDKQNLDNITPIVSQLLLKIVELENQLANKADKASVDTQFASINQTLGNKQDKVDTWGDLKND